ncbi:aldehyde dehydrogenase family protein, partial [Streptomyces sp. NPDC006386]|uniref:aldehyde dehydrogenase family protein n=1 Tax=Streptomyces sp. NPDC006386 TaxID=3156762 RepID=UPI0033AB7134
MSQIGLVGGLIGELVEQAGSLPAGVLNVFTESGNEGAPLLVSSPDVDVLSYTGSTVVGRKIMESAAATLKPLSLELGGKSPMLVFDDADLDATVPVLVKAITTFAGQFCMTGSRVLAQRGIADELRRRLAQALEAVKVGPGDDPASDMGAMIDERNAERVERMVADAAAYADIVVRGERDRAFLRPSLVEALASLLLLLGGWAAFLIG